MFKFINTSSCQFYNLEKHIFLKKPENKFVNFVAKKSNSKFQNQAHLKKVVLPDNFSVFFEDSF